MRSQRCNLEQRADRPIHSWSSSCQDPVATILSTSSRAKPTTLMIRSSVQRVEWWPGYFDARMMTKMISAKFSWNEWATEKWKFGDISKEWLSGCPPLVVNQDHESKTTHITRWSGTGGWNVVVVMMELRIHMTTYGYLRIPIRSWPACWSNAWCLIWTKFRVLIRPDACRTKSASTSQVMPLAQWSGSPPVHSIVPTHQLAPFLFKELSHW